MFSILTLQANKVNIRVKRMGGGFGGKESRYISEYFFFSLIT